VAAYDGSRAENQEADMLLLRAISHRSAPRLTLGTPLWHFQAHPSPPEQERQSQQGDQERDIHNEY
jgi:hypothetical protein